MHGYLLPSRRMNQKIESPDRVPLWKAKQVEIFRRDGWLCQWCRIPVIFAPTLRLLEREVRKSGYTGPLAYYHAHATRDGAPLLDELWAVLDHVEAHSKGGKTDNDNLVTACNKCNGRKNNHLLSVWDKRAQRPPIKGKTAKNGNHGEPQHWDGLSMVFIVLAQREESDLTTTERQWLKALA
jgi:5-methylcytosine-specific restriction endonuclease McrA